MVPEKEMNEQTLETAQMREGKMDNEQMKIVSGAQSIRDWSYYQLVKEQYRRNGKNGKIAALHTCSQFMLVSNCYSIVDEIEKDLLAEGLE